MYPFPFLLLFLAVTLGVLASPLAGAESLDSLNLSVPNVNGTPFNSTISEYAKWIYYSPSIPNANSRLKIREVTAPADPVPFHIENSTVTLLICDGVNVRIDETALRDTLFSAYILVSNLIDIAGEGELPASSDPYELVTVGVYITMSSDRLKKLRWSNVKDVLWSLREYMVIEGRSFQTAFLITGAESGDTLGFGLWASTGKETIHRSNQWPHDFRDPFLYLFI